MIFFSAVPSFALRILAALLLAGVALGMDAQWRQAVPPAPEAVWPMSDKSQTVGPLQRTGHGTIPMPAGAAKAHSSSLVAMPADSTALLTAFWFAGDRESAPNVQIAASQYDRTTHNWLPARYVVNRIAMGRLLGFGIRRLGNPVGWLDSDHRLHLFVVATGLGGWSAGRILHLRQSGSATGLQNLEFEPVEVLPLSWLWNTSYLVRTAPLPLADGGMVLPVYFEIGLKYPAAVRFDRHGNMLGLVRISRKIYALQPTLVMNSPTDWWAFMRDTRPDGKIIAAQTRDGGQHWSDADDLELVNPDASIAALGLAPNRLLLAHNASSSDRSVLDLSASTDGRHWSLSQTMVQGISADEYSYPAMVWTEGSLWVSYTDHRRWISWQRFEAARP